jgi:flagellar biosynthesis protein FliQ
MSLTFVPKLIMAVVVLAVAGPWMLSELMAYGTSIINSIPRML